MAISEKPNNSYDALSPSFKCKSQLWGESNCLHVDKKKNKILLAWSGKKKFFSVPIALTPQSQQVEAKSIFWQSKKGLGLFLALLLTCCVTTIKLLNLSVPQFPSL